MIGFCMTSDDTGSIAPSRMMAPARISSRVPMVNICLACGMSKTCQFSFRLQPACVPHREKCSLYGLGLAAENRGQRRVRLF